jgi:PEP-CTERM motif
MELTMNSMNSKIFAFSVAALALSDAAGAAPTTYQVDRTIGSGSVVGSITTDGQIGTLAHNDVLSWTFTLTDPNLAGGSPDTISSTNALQSVVGGADLLASGTQITFNFDSTDAGGAIFQGSDLNAWCFTNRGASCVGGAQAEVLGFTTTGSGFERVPQTGTQVIAHVATVPEPATLGLLALGLSAAGFARRKRKS